MYKRQILWIVLSIVVIMAIVGIVFVNQPSFGRIPRGERLARIERSPNYRDGAFRNIHETPLMTSDKGRLQGLLGFVFKDKTGLQPDSALTVEMCIRDRQSMPALRRRVHGSRCPTTGI